MYLIMPKLKIGVPSAFNIFRPVGANMIFGEIKVFPFVLLFFTFCAKILAVKQSLGGCAFVYPL